MPYAKGHTSSKSPADLTEDLIDTEVYIKQAHYAPIKHKIFQATSHFEPHLILPNEITPGITRTEYESRRVKLFRKIPFDSCLILPCNPEPKFSSDGKYPYRQHADMHYFTGLLEPLSLAIFTKDAAGNCQYILFVQPIIEQDLCWHGHRCGLSAAIKYFGAHDSYEYLGDDGRIFEIMDSHSRVYIDVEVNDVITRELQECIPKECKKKIRLLKPRKMLQQIRLIKSGNEVKLLRKSAQISSLAMIDAMQFCEPGMLENELCVQFEHGCKVRGAHKLSYECSVASGINAVNLNYFNNNSLLNANDLVLIDCGCEYNGYASDITRTFPVNGIFTPEQSALYTMVLSVSDALIALMRIGCTIKKLETTVNRLIKKGLKELGITKGLSAQTIKDLKVSCADVHFVCHFIGLDIHDTSEISAGKGFEENMILAIEPAVYIPDCELIPPQWRGIGIRIEDDVLITKGEAEILSKALPRTVSEIESFMKSKSMFPRIRPFNLLTQEDIDIFHSNSNGNSGDLIQIELNGYRHRQSGSEWCALQCAAQTLSCIRFTTKKKEEIEQYSLDQEYYAIKLLQQAIYQSEQAKNGRNKHSKPSKQKCQKKNAKPNGNHTGHTAHIKSKSIKIPKLSPNHSCKYSKSHSNARSPYAIHKHKPNGNRTSKSPQSTHNQSQSKPKPFRPAIVPDTNPCIATDHSQKCKKITYDTDSTHSLTSADTLINPRKKRTKKSLSHLSISTSANHRKRKREREDSHSRRHSQSLSHREHSRERRGNGHSHKKAERYESTEPPNKKNKLERNGNGNHRYKYKYNHCYAYPSPYPQRGRNGNGNGNANANTNAYYYPYTAMNGNGNDVMYSSYYAPSSVQGYQSNKSENGNTESAYDRFMAKSKDCSNA